MTTLVASFWNIWSEFKLWEDTVLHYWSICLDNRTYTGVCFISEAEMGNRWKCLPLSLLLSWWRVCPTVQVLCSIQKGSSALSLWTWKAKRRRKLYFCLIRGGQVVLCLTEPQEMYPNVSAGCCHGLGLQQGRRLQAAGTGCHWPDLALVKASSLVPHK